MPTELPDSAKVLRNDVGKRMATALEAIAQGGGGASVVQKTMAEYTALPTADKMNGSIYKITDKALIYCLDEEYHALKEITSADYALLTSGEKNNGTLYILTDEETTAADIPYSAGVSVADKLDSLSTVDTYTLTSTCIVYRVGKLCTLACTGSSIPANTGSYATRHILGTLPEGYIPPSTVFGTPTRFPTLSSFMVTNAGEVSVRNSDTSNAIDCFATLTYIATD